MAKLLELKGTGGDCGAMENTGVRRRPFLSLLCLHGAGGRRLSGHCRGVAGLAGVPKWQWQLIQLQCDLGEMSATRLLGRTPDFQARDSLSIKYEIWIG